MYNLKKGTNERKNKMEKSNKFLKVTGILMIIGGSINLLTSLLVLLFGVVFVTAAVHANLSTGEEVLAGAIVAGLCLIIAAAIIQFCAGIAGVKNAKNPDKAGVCIGLGILTLLIYIVSQLLNFLGGNINSYLDLLVVVIGLVVPALYLVGAFQLRAKEE